MIVKKHVAPDKRLILAVCDECLLGKCYEEDGLQLDLRSDFYQGKQMSEEELCSLIDKAAMVNAVGRKSVGMCVRLKGISKSSIKKIKGIHYCQIVML